jgi:hypothetical protein
LCWAEAILSGRVSVREQGVPEFPFIAWVASLDDAFAFPYGYFG